METVDEKGMSRVLDAVNELIFHGSTNDENDDLVFNISYQCFVNHRKSTFVEEDSHGKVEIFLQKEKKNLKEGKFSLRLLRNSEGEIELGFASPERKKKSFWRCKI
jgi:hypothetical protein